jgi:hypothetical protein
MQGLACAVRKSRDLLDFKPRMKQPIRKAQTTQYRCRMVVLAMMIHFLAWVPWLQACTEDRRLTPSAKRALGQYKD